MVFSFEYVVLKPPIMHITAPALLIFLDLTKLAANIRPVGNAQVMQLHTLILESLL